MPRTLRPFRGVGWIGANDRSAEIINTIYNNAWNISGKYFKTPSYFLAGIGGHHLSVESLLKNIKKILFSWEKEEDMK